MVASALAAFGGSNTIDLNKHQSLKDIINQNISRFNKKSSNELKEETEFSSVTSEHVITNAHNETIGTLLVFDNNNGYIFVDENNYIRDSNFAHGLSDWDPHYYGEIIFDAAAYRKQNGEIIHRVDEGPGIGGSVEGAFYWHADESFVTSKTRNLLHDWDSEYATPTNKTNAVFGGKTTWSTYQDGAPDCGTLAIANLLWTYKLNGVIDLTRGAASSRILADALRPYVNYDEEDGIYVDDLLNADNYFVGTGYYFDYCDVTNGISDTMEIAPLIGLYRKDNQGHFALVTGKGQSLYKKILGISFYTSWDITNTWYNYNTSQTYFSHKYWVDNQYIRYGVVLRNSQGHTVPLEVN